VVNLGLKSSHAPPRDEGNAKQSAGRPSPQGYRANAWQGEKERCQEGGNQDGRAEAAADGIF
jgi:hypothetical protein